MEVIKSNLWAVTGGYTTAEFREGFWTHSDLHHLDAPTFLAAGSMRASLTYDGGQRIAVPTLAGRPS